MVPWTLRVAPRRQPGRRAGGRTTETATNGALPGNRTTGILLDLPTGPMPLAERVAAIRAVRQARLRRGDADAAAFVLHSITWMPPPLQRAFARASFTSKRFNLIVSVFPGMRGATICSEPTSPPSSPCSPWPAGWAWPLVPCPGGSHYRSGSRQTQPSSPTPSCWRPRCGPPSPPANWEPGSGSR